MKRQAERDGGPAFAPSPRLYPFRSRYFESSVGPVHYLDEGAGPALLLLHGNPTWSFLYRGIVIRLRDRFRCVAPDYPGFGLSTHPEGYGFTPAEHAAVVSELVDALELDEITVVGQDWGGPVGMRVALDRPDAVRSLVMGNTWYWPLDPLEPRDLPLWAFSALFSVPLMRRLIVDRNLFVERLLPLGLEHAVAEEVLDHYRGPLSTPRSRRGVAELPRQLIRSEPWLRALADEVPDALGHKPLLLTWGSGDPAFRPSLADRFRADFESVRIVLLDARHFIQEDAPKEMAAAIREFL